MTMTAPPTPTTTTTTTTTGRSSWPSWQQQQQQPNDDDDDDDDGSCCRWTCVTTTTLFVYRLEVFVAKFLLEVCGAAGAIWGFSEVSGWRRFDGVDDDDDDDERFFRYLCLITFGIFLYRFYNHAKHWILHEQNFPLLMINHRRQHIVHFIQVFAAKLVLQVWGAGGAIWGISEVFGFRGPDNDTEYNEELWKRIALVTANLFFIRWIIEILSYCRLLDFRCCCCRTRLLLKKYKKNNNEEYSDEKEEDDEYNNNFTTPFSDRILLCLLQLIRWNESLVVKFILEVCGAAGAVWGFTDIVQWRHEGNSETFWRPVAQMVGILFAFRWLWHNLHFLFDWDHHHHHHLVTEPLSIQKRTSVVLSNEDLHVSHSIRRLSVTAMRSSVTILGLNKDQFQYLKDLDDDGDDDDDDDECSNGIVVVDDDDPEVAASYKDDAVASEVQQILTCSSTESYHSCDST